MAAVRNGNVELNDGTVIPSCTLIWTAGTSSHPLCGGLPCPLDRGRVKVNEFMDTLNVALEFAEGKAPKPGTLSPIL